MKDTIRQNIFTNSKSKHRWSFSKSKRFEQNKSTYDVSFYKQPSSLDKRSATFGKGERASLVDKSKQDIDPAKYVVPSPFQNKKRGFTFGSGRDQSKFQNYLKMLGDRSTSNMYNLDDSNLHKGKAFSIKQRTAYPPGYFLPNDPQSQRRGNMPSPLTYQTIDSIGDKFVESKHKNFGQRFSLTERFRKMKTLDIGPGAYDDRTIRADGQYILSNMRSSGKRTIFKGSKKSIFGQNTDMPGPGQYELLGDFGTIIPKEGQSKLNVRPKTARN